MRLASLLLMVVLTGVAAEPVRDVLLDSRRVVRVPVARDRLTTVRFPSPPSHLEGTYLSADEEPPALFQI